MNSKTFLAMLARDVHVARRNFIPLLLQVLLQPMLFVFVFGKVMISSGMMPVQYKSLLLPGIMAISMFLTGVQAVAMPLIAEFQFTREIEDRLLAPMHTHWLAVEKIVAGMVQSLIAGFVVVPSAWLLMGSGVEVRFEQPAVFLLVVLLVAFLAACGGLALGCSVGPGQIGLMFSLVVAPMIFFGCVYYPWSALKSFPILQKLVLLNPVVYASEGLRGTLVPQFPHLSLPAVIVVLVVVDVLLLMLGLRTFQNKALS
jgi:ABC-2 type transport system permease protein